MPFMEVKDGRVATVFLSPSTPIINYLYFKAMKQ